MNSRFRNVLLAASFAVAVTASGGVAASGPTVANKFTRGEVAQPGSVGDQQAGESVNDNKDDKDAGNLDGGQQGQGGDQQTGESVNDNKDQKDAGNLDSAQQGQAGEK
ncbi:MAG: hypothetical protein M3R21_06835 [Candidatus Dormibacteraeota bacterium]|nr:hypothetical protein [Candidatus Dormibacteraeota bacterium]